MALFIPVSLDGPTLRLLAVAQAVQQEGRLPAKSAKRLVALVKAARLYCQGREFGRAATALLQVEQLGKAAADEVPDLEALLQRHVGPIATTLAKS